MWSVRASWSVAVLLVVAAACARSSSPTGPGTPEPPSGPPLRVLLLTATTGFRHDSIPAARAAFSAVAAESGVFDVTATEDVAVITAARLAETDVLVFGLTTGELPFDASQKAAIVEFVERGGGFMGFHSATDTLYGWPEYGVLVGAYFKEHPWTQVATVTVEDRSHPATSGLPSFSIQEEFYTFRENPRGRVQVLMSLDASSVGATGDFPLVWVQTMGRGRVYYNALGHFDATWTNARFRAELLAAVRWAGNIGNR